MQRVSSSGHAFYNVALATFMIYQTHANLEEIKLLLAKAIKHGSDEAMYFNLMLRVLENERFSKNEVISSFQSLFNRRRLANCRNVILHTGGPSFKQNDPCFRPMILGLKYQFSCPSDRVCEGIRRVRNITFQLPGADEATLPQTFSFLVASTLSSLGFLNTSASWISTFYGSVD